MTIQENNICFFTTCSTNYLGYAITALSSFKRFYPQSSFYIFTPNEKIIIGGIEIKEFDSHNFFQFSRSINKSLMKKWPDICFWWYKIPELLAKEGFRFSCYLDPDVFCFRKHPFPINSPSTDMVLPILRKKYINTGYIWFNNINMLHKKFYETMVGLDSEQRKDKIRHEEDFLNRNLKNIKLNFNLELLNPKYIYFTYYTSINRKNTKRQKKKYNINNLYVVHYIDSHKPWKKNTEDINPIKKALISKYIFDTKMHFN